MGVHRLRHNRLRTHRLRTHRLIALAGASAALLISACGDDDGPSAEAASGTIEVAMTDYAYGGLPAEVFAGSRIEVTNTSDSELHEFVTYRLADGDERPVEQVVEESLEDLLTAGPPAAVLLAAPGGEQIPVVGDGTISEPGRYVVVCLIPTGADPAEYLEAAATSEGPPEVEGGPPHIANGMLAEFTVVEN